MDPPKALFELFRPPIWGWGFGMQRSRLMVLGDSIRGLELGT